MRLFSVSIPIWYDYDGNPTTKNVQNFFVSIPIWYDYDEMEGTFTLRSSEFQFQSGTITTLALLPSMITTSRVSIPIWYDYDNIFFGSKSGAYVFQFQSGTITTGGDNMISAGGCMFQFQSGTITTNFPEPY